MLRCPLNLYSGVSHRTSGLMSCCVPSTPTSCAIWSSLPLHVTHLRPLLSLCHTDLLPSPIYRRVPPTCVTMSPSPIHESYGTPFPLMCYTEYLSLSISHSTLPQPCVTWSPSTCVTLHPGMCCTEPLPYSCCTQSPICPTKPLLHSFVTWGSCTHLLT
jgi:hypothetical protein